MNTPRPDAAIEAVRIAEELVARAATALLRPAVGECLLCYVHRMLTDFGCGTTLRFVGYFRDVRAPRATALDRRLGSMGAYCDCELFLNAYDLRPEHWMPEVLHERGGWVEVEDPTWPRPLLACLGVRAGSTQPCGIWARRWRDCW